jgi:hypothetical protein
VWGKRETETTFSIHGYSGCTFQTVFSDVNNDDECGNVVYSIIHSNTTVIRLATFNNNIYSSESEVPCACI